MTLRYPEVEIAQAHLLRAQGWSWDPTPNLHRLTESLEDLPSVAAGTFVHAVFPVRPIQRPVKQDTIFVDMFTVPVLSPDPPMIDSPLVATGYWAQFRAMVMGLGLAGPELIDASDNTKRITIGAPEYQFINIRFAAGSKLRFAGFRARYTARINAADGSLVFS